MPTPTYKVIRPHSLLLASRFDVTCDFVVSQLRKRSVDYLRLNSEDLGLWEIEFDPVNRQLSVIANGIMYLVTPDCLRSVFFRRPVFLRDYGASGRTLSEQFSRNQWAAFIRNLMVFHEATWVNDPTATYRAEHKALQLSVASDLGFKVPDTRITNTPHPKLFGDDLTEVAIKGLDTVLLRDGENEIFGFTTFGQIAELKPADWHSAPAIIQAALINKLDLRITVVEDRIFPAQITSDGLPIQHDWRSRKSGAEYSRFDLPSQVEQRCIELVKHLGLRFGGIDLVLQDNEYFFLEVNPTGEWAWLVDSAGLPIDSAIADVLARKASADG